MRAEGGEARRLQKALWGDNCNGVAWLPESCIKRERHNRDLVIIGNDDHRISMDIRIYRAKQTAKPEAERLWYYLLEHAA